MFIGEFVICRTRSAGVHCGILKEQCGIAAVLTDARRIWRWRGANTLNELALRGADMGWTRISEAVPMILLTEVIECIPCTVESRFNLAESRWPV